MSDKNKVVSILVDAKTLKAYKGMRKRKVNVGALISDFINSLFSETDCGNTKINFYDDGYATGYNAGVEKSKFIISILREELKKRPGCQKG